MIDRVRLLSPALAVLALCLLNAPARGAVIVVIDVTDPQAVTFTATGAAAENDDDQSFLIEGISLIDFFTGAIDDFSVFSFEESDLSSPEGNFPYADYASSDFFGEPYFYDDLSVFGSGFSIQGFSTGAPALSGSAVADMSAWMAFLPVAGAGGDVYSGDGISYSGPVIGQYVVVPEPSTGALLAIALALTGLRRRP